MHVLAIVVRRSLDSYYLSCLENYKALANKVRLVNWCGRQESWTAQKSQSYHKYSMLGGGSGPIRIIQIIFYYN